jgi:hypothetical protein
MKKNLKLLTGIAFLITILVAGGCGNSSKKKVPPKEEATPKIVADDSTKVDIYLKAVVIDGSMHLEMYEEKKSECPVIDGLLTVVYGGYTVTWRKADNSIDEIVAIRPIDDVEGIFGSLREREAESLWTLEIPEDPDPDTIKYEIDFIVKDHKDTTYTIDPYLKIPKGL